jgi:hypothetical protein
MKLRLPRVSSALPALMLSLTMMAGLPLTAQTPQPPGVSEALQNMASEHASRTAFTFDRDMLQTANALLSSGSGAGELSSVSFETYRYREPAFYIPEAMHGLIAAYSAAGWQHLVNQNASPRESASPTRPLTDLWMHFRGTNIDALTVLIRAPREMTVVEVSGELKPMDLLHLGGHFGIPRVDPNAVMVPAPPGH